MVLKWSHLKSYLISTFWKGKNGQNQRGKSVLDGEIEIDEKWTRKKAKSTIPICPPRPGRNGGTGRKRWRRRRVRIGFWLEHKKITFQVLPSIWIFFSNCWKPLVQSYKLKDALQDKETSKLVEQLTKEGNAAQDLRKKRGRALKSDGELSDDGEPVNSKRNREQEKRRKRAEEYLKEYDGNIYLEFEHRIRIEQMVRNLVPTLFISSR